MSYEELSEKWADTQRSGKSISHHYLEKPAMYSKLPSMQGKRVLCIGCGSGEECGYIKGLGAERVVGIDISKGLIEQARHTYPEIEFEVMDMQSINFENESFDFVYSSLAIHYVDNWIDVFSNVYRVLKPGGVFLFSTHHPIKWGSQIDKDSKHVSVRLGYNRSGDKAEIYGDYLNERKMTETIRQGLKIDYFHKPISKIIRDAVRVGFEILDFVEPAPIEAAKKELPQFWEVYQKIPLFMIFELKKKKL